jgi:hypothetical protein
MRRWRQKRSYCKKSSLSGIKGVFMRQPIGTNRSAALLLTGLLALPLAGCGSSPSEGGMGSTLGNLIAFNSTTAPPAREIKGSNEVDVECPEVLVADGQAAFRTHAGADKSSASVRHQYSFGEISRECRGVDGRIDIRVGVSGYVLSGPMGGPGSFQVPVRVFVRRDSDGQTVQSKTYKVAATNPPDQAQGPFSIVTEPLTVPLLRTDASQDYSIFVGFDGTPEKPQKPAPKQRKN